MKWAIRIRLEISGNARDLALFSLGLDSKLRGCDLVSLRVRDIALGMNIQSRAALYSKSGFSRKLAGLFSLKLLSRLEQR